MTEHQQIFIIEACEELAEPAWTASGEVEENLSIDFIGTFSSVELAYQCMKSHKNFIRGNQWHFRLSKTYLDDLDGKALLAEDFINPASL